MELADDVVGGVLFLTFILFYFLINIKYLIYILIDVVCSREHISVISGMVGLVPDCRYMTINPCYNMYKLCCDELDQLGSNAMKHMCAKTSFKRA